MEDREFWEDTLILVEKYGAEEFVDSLIAQGVTGNRKELIKKVTEQTNKLKLIKQKEK